MKAVACIGSKHWNNCYSIFRTADGLGFDFVYIVDMKLHKIPRMNRKKIDLSRKPWDKIVLMDLEEFLEIIPLYDSVSMELVEDAVPLYNYQWGEDPLIILGPENGNVPDKVLAITDKVQVPMHGLVKCFNVACAGSIAMYDYMLKRGM